MRFIFQKTGSGTSSPGPDAVRSIAGGAQRWAVMSRGTGGTGIFD